MDTKPPIMVTDVDLQRLQPCFTATRDGIAESGLESLDEELTRAQVIEPSAAPPTLVTMNSRIIFERIAHVVYQPEAAGELHL
jgi:regulator of nucleoside diphosphate kinase